MKDFAGKICFITGGASGAGLGQAKVFGREGMKVAIADIRQDALSSAVEELVDFGIKRENILAIKVDLTNREEYAAAADKVEEVFGGPPHLLIQTAASIHSGRSRPPPLTILTGLWAFVCSTLSTALLFCFPHDKGIRP